MYLYLSLFKKKMTNSIIIRRQLGVSLVAEVKKQTCQAQRSSPTRKKLRFCPNWRPPLLLPGLSKNPINSWYSIYEVWVSSHLRTPPGRLCFGNFWQKVWIAEPPPCPCTDKNKIFAIPKSHWTAPLRSHTGSMHAIIIWWQIIADHRCFHAF